MNTDLLQQLKGLELPPEPAFWPPAPGWWLVFAALLAAIAWASVRLAKRYRLARPRRSAKAELAALRQQFHAGEIRPSDYVDSVNELLKRLVLRYQPADSALIAFGESWLRYLDDVTNGEQYSSGPGHVLGNDRYQRQIETDWQAFDALIDRTLPRIGQ